MPTFTPGSVDFSLDFLGGQARLDRRQAVERLQKTASGQTPNCFFDQSLHGGGGKQAFLARLFG
ncbi:MAG: hypothetical protein A2140_01560 [Candidatus Muproteobacteria bacterium RBG_16_62_13]|uniref:Uncharacterized protein n=1 Tax=Candidatus Muproteobacteria bacterium RBG_16_62_13 TaxID=1817756 RepID=A0A1F6SYG0_9PROT|nr:MAG: hypothetical protein A2140_01560 [Candidatus Muproteobacteria bacterium RBG_16_62_13]